MSDFIDRQAALNEVRLFYDEEDEREESIEERIAGIPSVDAVEVVRCGDCRFWDKYPSSSAAPDFHRCHVGIEQHHTRAYDFCSDGERKDG